MLPTIRASLAARSIALTVALGLSAAAPMAMAAEPAPTSAPPADTTTPAPAPAPTPVAPAPVAPAPAPSSDPAAPVGPAPAPSSDPAAPVAPAPAPVDPAPAAPAPTATTVPVQPAPAPAPSPQPPPQDESREKEGRTAKAMLIAGWSTFATSYTLAAAIGLLYNDATGVQNYFGHWMLVPLIGPIGAATESESSFGKMVGVGFALAEIGGLTVGVLGTVRYRRWKNAPTLSALPMRGGGRVGLSMRF